ncbi:MAG: TetR/AcrR family transcriptional regulator [Lachnospiraceae bacterium]|nr:TetR/AcrR family transcriptional regulator [Lachnospiraceae bacterium]
MKTELEKKEILRLSNIESNRITKECLQIALMKLMGEKDFEKISITEITKCAGVSRTAFYRNYDSKEAIIEDACQSIFTKLRESLERNNRDWKSWYITFFQTVLDNKESVKIVLDASIPIVPKQVLNSAFPPESPEEHYANSAKEAAFTRILTDWFYDGMKESPKQMGDICEKILSPTTLSYSQF